VYVVALGAGVARRYGLGSGRYQEAPEIRHHSEPSQGVKHPCHSVGRSHLLHNPQTDTMFPHRRIHVLSIQPRTARDLPSPRFMNDAERLSQLRHDLSNPLSALLAETQLLLLNEASLDPETVTSLKEIEGLAIRMRTMLREL
jgi:signal transduction histidine kinase